MSQEQLESECLEMFKRGKKRDAERLLPQIRQPAKVRTAKYCTLIVNGFKIPIGYQSSLLHLAAAHGWMDIVIDLITKYKCDANCKNYDKSIPLHYASVLEVVRYLINEHHCNPMTKNDSNETPLYCACRYGNLSIVQYLINEQQCDPMTKTHLGWTPLHYACQHDLVSIAQYLINEQHCDPMTKDIWNMTPLHSACANDNANIVQYLLSTGKVDPLANDFDGKTPMYYAADRGNYDLLKLFRSFPQFKRDFPVHTYTKLVLTGYSGAGKTTTSQLIHRLDNEAGLFSALSSGRVTNVECLTAGIIPLHVESKVKEVGNMVIYDFAGQQEYYSSHAAVLERIMRNYAAIFVCIVDLSQCMDKISESIHYTG